MDPLNVFLVRLKRLVEFAEQYLRSRGLTVMDFGATTNDPADDYPDFAKPARWPWANGRAEFGLLVCTSGVVLHHRQQGQSVSARGSPRHEQDAVLMRQHNDVNVLCLSGKKNSARKPPKKFSTLSSPQI